MNNLMTTLGRSFFPSQREAAVRKATREYLSATQANPVIGSQTFQTIVSALDSAPPLPPPPPPGPPCSANAEDCDIQTGQPYSYPGYKPWRDERITPWSPDELPIEIVVHPHTAASIDPGLGTNCQPITSAQADLWQKTAEAVSIQFKETGIPISVVWGNATSAAAAAAQIPMEQCASLNVQNKFAAGVFQNNSIATISDLPITYTHELGHALGLPHPQDIYDLKKLDPDFAQLLCEGAPGHAPATMVYQSSCAAAGYFMALDRELSSDRRFSPIDVCSLQIQTTNQTQQDAALDRCENQFFDAIAAAYGWRVAGYAVANLVAETVEGVLQQAVARSIVDPAKQDCAFVAVKLVSKMIQAALLVQMTTGAIPISAVGYLGVTTFASERIFKSGLLGAPLRALLEWAGHLNLLTILAGAIRGNVWPAAVFGSAVGGKSVGKIIVAIFEAVLEQIAPPDHLQKEALQKARTAPAIDPNGRVANFHAALNSAVPSSLEPVAKKMRDFCDGLTKAVDEYINLNCLTSWIYKSDQEEINTAVGLEAGIAAALSAVQPDHDGATNSVDLPNINEGAESSPSVEAQVEAPATPAERWGEPLAQIPEGII